MSAKTKFPEGMPRLSKVMIDEAYSHFPDFLFFTTVKTGERLCRCTACESEFMCGINVLQRTYNQAWSIADTARHGENICCPVCGKRVKVINSKLQKRLSNPRIEISVPTAFFYGIDERTVWVCCYFINRDYSPDGKSCFDEQFLVNAYRLTPEGAEFYKRPWSTFSGWYDELFEEEHYREPFKWDVGLMHRHYSYSFIYATARKLNDTFLRFSGYEEYLKHNINAPMLQYWCWYCDYPQLEMLSKLGRFETVNELVLYDKPMTRLLNWSAQKPWELYRLTKNEYKAWCKLPSYEKIPLLKLYRAAGCSDPTDFEYCRWVWCFACGSIKRAISAAKRFSVFKKEIKDILKRCEKAGTAAQRFKNSPSFAERILKYSRAPKDVFAYFERISRNSAGCCWHCPGITVSEVIDMWNDYVDMGDDGSKSFNPFPSDLKGAHDALLKGKSLQNAKQLRKNNKELIARLGRKYKKANANCRALAEKYSYDNGTFAFITPKGIADVLIDGWQLNQCTARADASGDYWRYLDRINRKETYIGFVRRSDTPNTPWFTIEFEPSGTVRQKRAEHDSQPAELMPLITAFLVEWQRAIAPRLAEDDMADARAAKAQRIIEFQELRQSGKKVAYGELAGTLLIEAFEKDLMEIEEEIA